MPPGEHERRRRVAALAMLAGSGVAIASIPLAALADAPYLSFERVNPWLITFAIGLFAALFAVPFALHAGLGGLLESDARWERALLWWGGVALGVLAAALLLASAGGFDADSLSASVGIVAAVEAALVLVTLGIWLVSG